MYRRTYWSGGWPSLGLFGAAILGAGLIVIGAAIGIGGGDVPDGWVETRAEIVDPPPNTIEYRRIGGALANVTERFLRFEDAGGEVVEERCEFCWGGIGDEVSIAFNPVGPPNPRQLDFHRYAAGFLVFTGAAFLGVGVWWSSRRSRDDDVVVTSGP